MGRVPTTAKFGKVFREGKNITNMSQKHPKHTSQTCPKIILSVQHSQNQSPKTAPKKSQNILDVPKTSHTMSQSTYLGYVWDMFENFLVLLVSAGTVRVLHTQQRACKGAVHATCHVHHEKACTRISCVTCKDIALGYRPPLIHMPGVFLASTCFSMSVGARLTLHSYNVTHVLGPTMGSFNYR